MEPPLDARQMKRGGPRRCASSSGSEAVQADAETFPFLGVAGATLPQAAPTVPGSEADIDKEETPANPSATGAVKRNFDQVVEGQHVGTRR